jgi:hypothetical protein
MFVPCHNKEDLHTWISVYLGFNMPDTIVDPDSNCSPMDAIWEVYKKAMDNDDPDFSRVMVYASRDSFKTMGAAILEVLAVIHLDRDVGHMAAVTGQARKAQSYVRKFFRMPYLRDYSKGLVANTEKMEFVWYSNDTTGDCITKAQFEALPDNQKMLFVEHERYIKIVVCTMAGANSDHFPFFVVDEVDVVPKQNQAAYEEAKSIPGAFEGKEPITVLTSTRKFAFGNVQRELDKAEKTGLVVRHWNIIDVTERCPTSRHLPEEPKIPIWVYRDEFEALSQEQYEGLKPEDQKKFEKDEGYAGCLKNCKLFAMCRGNLATRQKVHPKNAKNIFIERPMPLLKSLGFTTNKFNQLSRDMARAQLMCWEASQEGLIYNNLTKEKHVIKPYMVAEKVLGEKQREDMTPEMLLKLLTAREGRWIAGVDFGFTHNFACVLIFIDGNRAFVVGSWSQPELDPAEKVELLERTIRDFDPVIYPDMANADMIKFLKKHKFRVREWEKGPGSVLGGIEAVRFKLKPGLIKDPEMFFMEGGEGIQKLVDEMKMYHWELGLDGTPTDVPDEVISSSEDGDKVWDDSCDAVRYAIMNVFANRGKISAPQDVVKTPSAAQVAAQQKANQNQNQAWAKQMMNHALGYSQPTEDPTDSGTGPALGKKGKKGSLFWDLD